MQHQQGVYYAPTQPMVLPLSPTPMGQFELGGRGMYQPVRYFTKKLRIYWTIFSRIYNLSKIS